VTVRVALATIAACATLFAALGGGAGWAIGTNTPGYYRAVCRAGQEPWFDPVEFGIGQGVGQGAAGGAVVGLAVVALFVWRDIRAGRSAGESESSPGSW
jgi:hypothetical protein